MDIINILGIIYCIWMPTLVIRYIWHDCLNTLHECDEMEDEEDF